MKGILSLLFLSFSLSAFSSWNSLIPSTEGMSRSDRRAIERQVDALEGENYRVGNQEIYNNIQQAIQNQSVCNENSPTVRDGRRDRSIFSYDLILNDLNQEISNLPANCRHQFVRNFILFKADNDNPLESRRCRRNPEECNLVREFLSISQQNILNLGNAAYQNSFLERYCSDIDPNYDFSNLQDLLNNIESIEACTELGVGDTRRADGRLNGIAQRYTLRRTEDNRYELAFNIEYAQGNFATATPEELYARTNDCLANINATNQFRGPNNQIVDLRVYSPAQANELEEYRRPPVSRVTIMDDDHRSHSAAYAGDITCDVIVHEIMHLTGLADEYRETQRGTYLDPETGEVFDWEDDDEVLDNMEKSRRQNLEFQTAYMCRAIPETPSIMKSQTEALNDVLDRQILCRCGDDGASLSTARDCQMLAEPANVRELYVRSLSSLSNSIEGYQDYCRQNRNRPQEPLEFFRTPEEITSRKIIRNYQANGNRRNFSNYRIQLTASDRDYAIGTAINIECECDESLVECRSFLQRMDQVNQDESLLGSPTYCPYGLETVQRNQGNRERITEVNPENEILLTIPAENPNSPLLRAAHFEKVLFPECESRASRYVECTSYAYADSEKECEGRPEYCEDEALWLDSAQ